MNQDQGEKIKAVITKCWTDEAFKKNLINDTAATLKAEGIDVAPGYTVNVLENTGKVMNFIIPPNPNGKLTDDQLEAVAGGKLDFGPVAPGSPQPGAIPGIWGFMGGMGRI